MRGKHTCTIHCRSPGSFGSRWEVGVEGEDPEYVGWHRRNLGFVRMYLRVPDPLQIRPRT
eukprot:3385033-Pyramimonas_sp.AAC.1